MMQRTTVQLWVVLLTCACGTSSPIVPCGIDEDCDLAPGGSCELCPFTENKWCQYPDLSCPAGRRWSDFGTTQVLSGVCLSCLNAGDCGVDTTCRSHECVCGECRTVDQGAGTQCSDDGGRVCDGGGSCVQCNSPLDCPVPAVCHVATCSDHICGDELAQAGAPCEDGIFCNGNESCDALGGCGMSTGDPCPGPDGDEDCSETCNESQQNCSGNDPNGSTCPSGTCMNGTCQ